MALSTGTQALKPTHSSLFVSLVECLLFDQRGHDKQLSCSSSLLCCAYRASKRGGKGELTPSLVVLQDSFLDNSPGLHDPFSPFPEEEIFKASTASVNGF